MFLHIRLALGSTTFSPMPAIYTSQPPIARRRDWRSNLWYFAHMEVRSSRTKAYLTALWLELYHGPGAMLIPVLVTALVVGINPWIILFIGVVLALAAIRAASVDAQTLSEILTKLRGAKGSPAWQFALIYAALWVVYSLVFSYQDGKFIIQNIWVYVGGALMYLLVFLLRPRGRK